MIGLPSRPASRSTNPQPSAVRTFRQRGAVATGWFLIATFAVIVVAINTDSGPTWSASLLLVGAGLAAYLLLVRPAVRISAAGVHLANLVRTVDLTWPAVDILEYRWNLKVVTPDGDVHSSWAISAQRPKMAGGVTATSGGRLVPTGTSTVPMGQTFRPGSAGAVAEAITAAKDDYDRAVAGGHIAPQPSVVRRGFAPVAVAGWLVALVAAVVGGLLI